MDADVHKREAQTLESSTSHCPKASIVTTVQPASQAAALAKVSGSRWMCTV
jgi:hypothetical protein